MLSPHPIVLLARAVMSLKKDRNFAAFLYFLPFIYQHMLLLFIMQNTKIDPTTAEIKLLVFDMGGVFIRYEWDAVCRGFSQAAGISNEEFERRFLQANNYYYERGKISTAELVSRLNPVLGLNLSEEEFAVLWNTSLDEDLQMTALFKELRQKFPLYLLSNINDSHFTFIENKFNVSRHFDELILSHEVGHIKPEPEIYHEVLRRSGMQPQHCLFIDDLQPNVEGAQAVGLHAFQFTGIDDLHNKFNEFNIKV